MSKATLMEETKLPDQARVTPEPGMAANRNNAWRRMTRTVAHYERFEQIGEGTYGQVYRAKCLDTGRIVALKKTRIMSSKGYVYGMPLQLIREIKILKQLQHPNLLQLIEVVTSKGVEHLDPDDPPTTGENSSRAIAARQTRARSDDNTDEKDDAATLAREKYKGNLFLVLEYVSHDLTGLLDIAYQFSEVQIKCVFQQLLRALSFMHQHKVVHRDIKSSNILIDSRFRLKLADFGLARSLEPPLLDQMEANGTGGSTMQDISYKVITLWYRPPEILLGTVQYDFKVDLWSAGCILAELIANKPLMPGKSELEQLSLVAEIVGTPDKDTWDYLMSLKKSSRVMEDTTKVNARAEELQLGEKQHSQLREKFRKRKASSEAACTILEKLLEWDPRKRITADMALESRFFWMQPVPPSNPEELGSLDVAEDGHFHEFQTKQKRREAKAIAEEKKDQALRDGMTKSEADAVYDENYQGLMMRVAKEGIIGSTNALTAAQETRTSGGEGEIARSTSRRSRNRDSNTNENDESDSGKHRTRKRHRREREDVNNNDGHEEKRSRRRPSEEREKKDRKSRRDSDLIDVEPTFSPVNMDESERRSSRERDRGREKSKERKKSKRKDSKRDRHHRNRERDERKRRPRDDGHYSPGPDSEHPRGIRDRSPGGYGPPTVADRYGPARPGILEPGSRDGQFDRRPLPSDNNNYGPSGHDRDRRESLRGGPPRDGPRQPSPFNGPDGHKFDRRPGPPFNGPGPRAPPDLRGGPDLFDGQRRRGPDHDEPPPRRHYDDRPDRYRDPRMDVPRFDRHDDRRDREREPHADLSRNRDGLYRRDFDGPPRGRDFERSRNDGPPPDFKGPPRGRDDDFAGPPRGRAEDFAGPPRGREEDFARPPRGRDEEFRRDSDRRSDNRDRSRRDTSPGDHRRDRDHRNRRH